MTFRNKKKPTAFYLIGAAALLAVSGLVFTQVRQGHAQTQEKASANSSNTTTSVLPPKPGSTDSASVELVTPAAPEVDAKSWVLFDYASGQVLASKEADLKIEPASITKMMTSYVISAELKAGKIKLTDPVFISENAWRGGGGGTDGSTSFIPLNAKVPLKDLLYGMIIQSGNDASIALAEHVAGDESSFAALMNATAKKLGMTQTNYVNATGLSAPNHFSTAHDIAILSKALIRDYPEEYAVYAIKEFTFNNITQHNRNQLLWRDATVDGIKTGHHSAAGYCLAASSKRGDMRLISVVLGSASEKSRADAAQALLNYGFRFFETHAVFRTNQAVQTVKIWKGVADQLQLGVAEDALVTVPRGAYSRLQAKIDVPKPLSAPVLKGQEIGKLKVELDGKVVFESPLIAQHEVKPAGFFKRVWDAFWMWWES